jgi:hypothetical protein
MLVKVEYISNNSGGSWWLKDADWTKLEKNGWDVRWLGTFASNCYKEFEADSVKDALREAIRDWEHIIGKDASDEGCNCCGPPHSFSAENGKDWEYASGEEVVWAR